MVRRWKVGDDEERRLGERSKDGTIYLAQMATGRNPPKV